MCILVRHWRAIHKKVVRLVLDLWWVAEKTALIYVRTTKAQTSLRIPAGWSAPLLFAIAHFFFDKEVSHKFKWQNDIWNLIVSHRSCHFRAIQPFDFFFVWSFLKVSTTCLQTAKALAILRLCAWAFAGCLVCLCDKYPFLMCWLSYVLIVFFFLHENIQYSYCS